MCRKNIDGINISYLYENKTFNVKSKDNAIEYEVINGLFIYTSQYEDFIFCDLTDYLTCNIGPCDNYMEIYDKYYTNLIKKYLK